MISSNNTGGAEKHSLTPEANSTLDHSNKRLKTFHTSTATDFYHSNNSFESINHGTTSTSFPQSRLQSHSSQNSVTTTASEPEHSDDLMFTSTASCTSSSIATRSVESTRTTEVSIPTAFATSSATTTTLPLATTTRSTPNPQIAPDMLRLLVCPLTKTLLNDPVILSDGFTYERVAIAEYLLAHHTSPVTGELLMNKIWIPNRNLKMVIDCWLN
eukprot:c17773_g1_i1.p1 GENE.c17773_g1_i1~~c17773_g1_i1.p1  ORF type:complete len:215 (+),score=45.56 c17773_g1_i1:314-958(+)